MLTKWRYVGVIPVALPEYSRGAEIGFKMNQTFYFLCCLLLAVAVCHCSTVSRWSMLHSRLSLFLVVHNNSALLPHLLHQQRPCCVGNDDSILLVLYCGHGLQQ